MAKQSKDRVKASLWLPVQLWKQVKILAIHRDVDATDLVIEALENYLKTSKKGN